MLLKQRADRVDVVVAKFKREGFQRLGDTKVGRGRPDEPIIERKERMIAGNRNLAAGGTVSVGFLANSSGTVNPPINFLLREEE